MSIIFHFVDNQPHNCQNLQYVQAELVERLKEFSDQIKEDGVFLQGPLKTLSQFVIEEVVVGNGYLAFRLQDGRVCRTAYSIKAEKSLQKQEKVQKRFNKGVLDKLVNIGTAGNTRGVNMTGTATDPPLPKSFTSARTTEASQASYITQTNSDRRNSLPHRIARYQMLSSSHSSAPRVNFIREMQRQGIYFARTFSTPIAASEVPEELIEQCQTVLQGKSRQLIIRELQRTNLDVNMAVNNLLSRDDEADENGGSSIPDDWDETDDLLSLLDHADNPLLDAAVTDNGLGISDDIFPSIRLRRESLYSSMANDIESFADKRKRRRIDCQLRGTGETISRNFVDATYPPRTGNDSPSFTPEETTKSETNTNKKNCLVLGSSLEFWKEKVNGSSKGKELKFIKISGLYSELVGITTDFELHQWRWCDAEPWSSNIPDINSPILQSSSFWSNTLGNYSSQSVYYHPRLVSLNLLGEKIVKLSTSSSRATVLTSSGKLATWVDEAIAPIFQVLRNSDQNYTTQNLRVEHPAVQFGELKEETIAEVYVSSLVSAVKCTSGNIYWWGVIPFKYRKTAMEKNRDRIPKDDSKYGCNQENKRNKNDVSNITLGSFVCMRNAPIFHAGAIGFTVSDGIPRVGTLLEDAWKIEDICRFSVKPVQTLVNERRNTLPNSVNSVNPASFDPITHAHTCPQMNTSFLYGLLGTDSSNKQVSMTDPNQNSNDGISIQFSNSVHRSTTSWAEMPPPPSPASSTCSDQSGPVKISPGTFKRKKHSVNSSNTAGDLITEVNTESRPPISGSNGNRSNKARSSDSFSSSNPDYEPLAGHKRSLTPDDNCTKASNASNNVQQQEEEEDWCLKDVIFLEDGRTQPVGVVLKVDGSIAAVKFLKDSERACVAVNCPFSPIAAVFGNNSTTCTESNNATTDPISWLNDCRLLRKEELVTVKQPLISRVPEIVQKYPKCLPVETYLDSKPSSNFSPGIIGMALENEIIHLLVRKPNAPKIIEYKLLSFSKKIISSHRLNTSTNGFLGRCNSSLMVGPLESEFCELKNGTIFNVDRYCPIFIRDGNGTVYPFLFNDNHTNNSVTSKTEPIPSPHWLDLPPVRCIDFGVLYFNNSKNIGSVLVNNHVLDNSRSTRNKYNRLFIGVFILESQTLMHHIVRADEKKVTNILENFLGLPEFDSLVSKSIGEKLDGQRNILHVAVNMCQAISNIEVDWKLSSILNYRSKKSQPVNTTVEDLSQRSNWSLEHSISISSLPYRRWIETGRSVGEAGIFNYSRTSDRQSSSVRFTVMSSSNSTRSSIPVSEMNTGWFLPPAHLEEKEKRANSYKILNLLINHPNMDKHLVSLLSQRNSDGQTPFMQAVSLRIYPVALFIFDCILDICDTQYVSASNSKNQLAVNMLFPQALNFISNKGTSNTLLDDNPLQVLCQNDGCSFTWTGPDHIRQDIFECRTCGLTESLCCCTECARVCHKGHDCHLKKTSPTAYCDCWEKCRCKALLIGDIISRQELLRKLLNHTDFATLPNRRKEHLLLFLVKTVDRQFREHKQSRSSNRRHPSSVLNGRHTNINNATVVPHSGILEPQHPAYDPPMPEYGLEPSSFALTALDSVLANWPSIETLFLAGDKADWLANIINSSNINTNNNGINPLSDDEVFLNYQSFSEQLDQFVFTLIAKTPSSSVDILLNTINKQLQHEKMQLSHKSSMQSKVKRVASRLIRSVARVYVALQLQMAPDFNRKRHQSRLSNNVHVYSAQLRPLDVCKRIFECLLFVSLSELPRIAADIIAPVRCGLMKPTTNYSHFYQISDGVRNLDQIFQSSLMDNDPYPDTEAHLDGKAKASQNDRTDFISSSHGHENMNRNNVAAGISTSNSNGSISNFNASNGSQGNQNRQNRRRPHDDVDGGSGSVTTSDNNTNEVNNSASDPPSRRRRHSTPISLSSRMNAVIDEEDDDEGHSSDDDNWNPNEQNGNENDERRGNSRINSIFLEESDGDGNTIEGENDIEGDMDMEVYDDDHDTDIVPETESDSDDSITSSICVTEYNNDVPHVSEAISTVQSGNENIANASGTTVGRVKEENIINTDPHDAVVDNDLKVMDHFSREDRVPPHDVPESLPEMQTRIAFDNFGPINVDTITSTDQNVQLESVDAGSNQSIIPSSVEAQTVVSNTSEWFRNQVDLDAISDDESDEDESSQNTEDDEQDELNDSRMEISQSANQRSSGVASENAPSSDNQSNAQGTSSITSGNTHCGVQTTQVHLARAFSYLIKLIAGLLNQMYYSREKNNQKEFDRYPGSCPSEYEYSSINNNSIVLTQPEEEHVLMELSQQLGPIWIWICQSMDFLESQVCFSFAYQRKHKNFKPKPVLTFDVINPSNMVTTTVSQHMAESNRSDFLKYVVSMMRASSDEHGDQVPVSLYAVNYCHLAYLVDSLLYLMRVCFGMSNDKVPCGDNVDALSSSNDDVIPVSADNLKREPTLVQEDLDDEQEDLNSLRPTIGSEYGDSIADDDTCPGLNYNLSTNGSFSKVPINQRRDCQQKLDTSEDSFFSRSDYPLGWFGLGADAFKTPISESLPLAHMPQLLQPPGPSDEVFGTLKRFEIDKALGIGTSSSSVCGRNNEGQLPLHMGFSSKWADRLLDNNIIFSGVPVGNLRTRWRYSLELLSNSFEHNVGLEPGSVLVDFTHFSLKETRFRKEMEKLRNQCRRDLSLIVNRDRVSIICDTVSQLNIEFSRRNTSNSNTPLTCHRFKVKFNDEPGEGNGVARSFLTVFAESVLSEEPLILNFGLNNTKKQQQQQQNLSRSSIYNRNEHSYIRMSAISRMNNNPQQPTPSQSTTNWQPDNLTTLSVGYNPNGSGSSSRNLRPAMRIFSNPAQSSVPPTTTQPNMMSSRSSNIRSDLLTYSSTAQRLISAIAIFASSASTTPNVSTSNSWGISHPSAANNLISSSSNYYSLPLISNVNRVESQDLSGTSRTNSSTPRRPVSLGSRTSSLIDIPIANNTLPDTVEMAQQPVLSIDNSTVIPNPASPLNQIGSSLDAATLAAGFTANVGSQAPIWVSSSWLSMHSNNTSVSNFRRVNSQVTPAAAVAAANIPFNRSYQESSTTVMSNSNISTSSANNQTRQINLYEVLRNKIALNDSLYSLSTSNILPRSTTDQILNPYSMPVTTSTTTPTTTTSMNLNASIYDILRNRIPGDEALIQQMAYSLTSLCGRSDLTGLLNQLVSKNVNMNDIIDNLMTCATQASRISEASVPESHLYDISERSSDSSQSNDSNLEVSIISFAMYLEGLLHSIQNVPNTTKSLEESTLSIDTKVKANQPKNQTIDPEQTPLFWQPGHRDFFVPRRVNFIDSNHEVTRNSIYRCVGRVIGITLLMNETMPLKLSRHVLKYILGLPIGWHDFAFFNSQLYESLRQLMQVALEAQKLGIACTPEDPLLDYNLNFTLIPREEEGGMTNTSGTNVINLIPNGEEIDVDSNNVFQYVKSYCLTRMITLVKTQLDQIKQGVYDVIPKTALSGLSPEDFRLLLNGTDEINVDVLISYTSFLDESSLAVSDSQGRVSKFKRWFWQVVRGFTSVQRQNLLYFWTSSPALPASNQGFQPMPTVTIRPADDSHLPTANTCISRLYIPLYSSKTILREKLLQAIETKSFGFV